MANETIVTVGTYTSITTITALADTNMSIASSTIAAALSATEEVYPLLDFKLEIASGTAPSLNSTFDLYRRPGDGTDAAPVPTTTYLEQYVGSFVLANANDDYYIYGVANTDPNDTYYVLNNGGQTSTGALWVRAKSYGTA